MNKIDNYLNGQAQPYNTINHLEEKNFCNIKGGHHIQTLIQNSNEVKNFTIEETLSKIKEGLNKIFSSKNKGHSSVRSFSKSKNKEYILLAYSIQKDQEKQEICVRFVGHENIVFNSKNIEYFKLGTIKPKVLLDMIDQNNFLAYIESLKNNDSIQCLYFMTYIKNIKTSKEKSYFSLSSKQKHKYILSFLNNMNKKNEFEDKLDFFKMDEYLLDNEKKSKFFEGNSNKTKDFIYKFKLKVKVNTKKIKKSFFNKYSKNIQKIKDDNNLLYYFPIKDYKKINLQTKILFPIYMETKSLQFSKKYIKKISLLSLKGKICFYAQKTVS